MKRGHILPLKYENDRLLIKFTFFVILCSLVKEFVFSRCLSQNNYLLENNNLVIKILYL